MAKAKHDETSAIRSLSKINGVSVNRVDRIITVAPGIHGAGNGSWGRIDYLRGVCGYLLRRDKPGRSNVFIPNDEDENGNTKRIARKSSSKKLNMVTMTKGAMNNNKK